MRVVLISSKKTSVDLILRNINPAIILYGYPLEVIHLLNAECVYLETKVAFSFKNIFPLVIIITF